MRMRLQGRRAIVTGAASGIGRATTALFADEGATVLAVDRPESEIATAHRGQPRVHVLAQDIAAAGAPQAIVDAAIDKLGGLDIVMNNAGVSNRDLAEQMTEAAWDRVVDINLKAQFLICQKAIPHLRNSPAGRIINVASVMAAMTDYGLAAYCASKAGVAGLTRTLALELGKFGITANYIEPGAIYTGLTRTNFDKQEIAEIWAKKAALRRLGQPIDIARGALFLASDDAGFVTGHGLRVDGGLVLRT
jgi:NAD(P)-dependent dehydrogenase (short-subunit alcohol dehydrogenase family)